MIAANQAVHGRFRGQIVNPQGEVVHDYGWQDNVILNQGMDAVASFKWADLFLYAALGTGSGPIYLSDAGTTASQSNVTVTLSGGSLRFTSTAVDAGRMVVWNDGSRARIIAVSSATTATVADSKLKTPSAFKYYLVTQTGLTNEVQRTGNFCTRAGYCSTIGTPPDTVVMQRSWDFPDETVDATYTELGTSWSGLPGNNLFSRILLSTPFVIPKPFHLRLSYQLTLVLSPTTPNAKVANILSWPSPPATNLNCTECLEDWGLSAVAANGLTSAMRIVNGVQILGNEPSVVCDILMTSDSQALSPPGNTPLNRWQSGAFSQPMVVDIYTPDTYSNTKTGLMLSAQGNMLTCKSIAYGHLVDVGNFLPVFNCMFAQNQNKSGPHHLRISFRYTWTRIFT